MSKYVLYTIPSCPKCSTVRTKLMMANIEYELAQITEEEMKERGIDLVPVLEIDGEMLDFSSTIKWLHGREKV